MAKTSGGVSCVDATSDFDILSFSSEERSLSDWHFKCILMYLKSSFILTKRHETLFPKVCRKTDSKYGKRN
jgi:hypothetical protein